MLEVERQQLNTLQTDVLRFGAEYLELSRGLDRLPSCKLAATIFGVILNPHRKREMKCISQELEWIHIEENQSRSAATSGGGVGPDDTTLNEVAEPSLFVAAGDRLLPHLDSTFSAACS